MHKFISNSFEILGLDEVDCQVYSSLLDSEDSNVLKLHLLTGLDRRKITKSLIKLSQKGLIEDYKSGKDKIIPIDPEKILTLLEFRQHEISRQKLLVKSEIENFKYKFKATKKTVKYYEGQGNYIVLFNSILDEATSIYHIGDEKSFVDTVGVEYFKHWLNQRKNRGIEAMDLTYNLENLTGVDISAIPNTKFATLPSDYKTPGSILFWSGKVAIFSSKNPKVVVIEDADIFQIFVQLWQAIYFLVGSNRPPSDSGWTKV